MRRLPIRLAFAVLLGSFSGACSAAAQKKPVTQPLLTASITGQNVSLLPLTYVIAEPSVSDSQMVKDRVTMVRLADSLVTEAMLSRSPEIQWVTPAELRKISKRNAGMVADPDKLGQAVMRTWSMETVPDPLRSNLRKLVSIAGSRYVLIPASLIVSSDSTGALLGDLSVVLADTRTGRVVWRSVAKGRGATLDEMIVRAVETIFPPEGG